MNKKGQALVEFIIIMPIMIMILLAFLDYTNIYQKRLDLENDLQDIITSSEKDQYIKEEKDNLITYEISGDVTIYSPVLYPVFGSSYEVKVQRTLNNE